MCVTLANILNNISDQFEEVERHAKKICLGTEANDVIGPTEADADKFDLFIERVRAKLNTKSSGRFKISV